MKLKKFKLKKMKQNYSNKECQNLANPGKNFLKSNRKKLLMQIIK